MLGARAARATVYAEMFCSGADTVRHKGARVRPLVICTSGVFFGELSLGKTIGCVQNVNQLFLPKHAGQNRPVQVTATVVGLSSASGESIGVVCYPLSPHRLFRPAIIVRVLAKLFSVTVASRLLAQWLRGSQGCFGYGQRAVQHTLGHLL